MTPTKADLERYAASGAMITADLARYALTLLAERDTMAAALGEMVLGYPGITAERCNELARRALDGTLGVPVRTAEEAMRNRAVAAERERDEMSAKFRAETEAEADALATRLAAVEGERDRLVNVIRVGGAMYRAERAAMGIPGGHDSEQRDVIVDAAQRCIAAWDRYGLFSEKHPELDPSLGSPLHAAHVATRALRRALQPATPPAPRVIEAGDVLRWEPDDGYRMTVRSLDEPGHVTVDIDAGRGGLKTIRNVRWSRKPEAKAALVHADGTPSRYPELAPTPPAPRVIEAADSLLCSGKWISGSGGHRDHDTCNKNATWSHPNDMYAYCDEHVPPQDTRALLHHRYTPVASPAPAITYEMCPRCHGQKQEPDRNLAFVRENDACCRCGGTGTLANTPIATPGAPTPEPEAPSPPQSEAPREVWRQGRKVGRTLYLNDALVGVMDTSELAASVVAAMVRAESAPKVAGDAEAAARDFLNGLGYVDPPSRYERLAALLTARESKAYEAGLADGRADASAPKVAEDAEARAALATNKSTEQK